MVSFWTSFFFHDALSLMLVLDLDPTYPGITNLIPHPTCQVILDLDPEGYRNKFMMFRYLDPQHRLRVTTYPDPVKILGSQQIRICNTTWKEEKKFLTKGKIH